VPKKLQIQELNRVVFVEPYPIKESYGIFSENNVEVKIFEGVKSLSFNWIFRKRGKYIKDHAYQRLQELHKLLKGGE